MPIPPQSDEHSSGDLGTIGSYRIVKELGASHMAKVYHAFDPIAEKDYAVKVLRILSLASEAETREGQQRFQNEIRALSRLSPHPNIPLYHHNGTVGTTQYFAMEFVRGESLDRKMPEGKPFPPSDAVRILRQVAAALDYAHEKGIAHRDIKPGNVMLQPDGAVKVIDFGIARIGSQRLTVAGHGWGTPEYMAPERIAGTDTGGSADQFSLAVLAYRLLTGRKPFTGQDDMAVQHRVLHAEPSRPTDINPSLPPRVDGVLRRGLAKAPADRYPTCGEFTAALADALISKSNDAADADATRRTRASQDDRTARPRLRPSAKYIGIDLGTTNSVVAVIEHGRPTVIPNPEGDLVMPSVVSFTDTGDALVGRAAKRRAITNPENTVVSVSRFMGRRLDESGAEMKLANSRFVHGRDGEARVDIGGRQLAPSEISACLIGRLKEAAELHLSESVTRAVLTVPVSFDYLQRQAVRKAGESAGLEFMRIISNPTAVALAYGFSRKESETIAVYDFGGGAFDIAIVEVGDGVVEVKSAGGDARLGGDDIDERLVEWLIGEFKKETGIDLSRETPARQRLREAAEKAKIELSTLLETEVNLPFVTADSSGPKHLLRKLTRVRFEQMVEDLLQRSVGPCKQAMLDAGVTPRTIDAVLLVGGQTRMPRIRALVRELFGRDPQNGVNPDEIVALGAAVQGGILSGEVKDVLPLDVLNQSLGIETLGGIFSKVIERNTTIPTRKSETFSTASDHQESAEIRILQGERAIAGHNRLLGTFRLDHIPPAPRGVPQIEVTFSIDANGDLIVIAKDRATNRERQLSVSDSTAQSSPSAADPWDRHGSLIPAS